jgi:hypothetical protein
MLGRGDQMVKLKVQGSASALRGLTLIKVENASYERITKSFSDMSNLHMGTLS